MASADFKIERLAKHDRSKFRSGSDELDGYLRNHASQDMRKRVAVCFVAVERESREVLGFYTLSAADILIDELPSDQAKGMPRYPTLPVARIGRLAVDKTLQGRGFGSALIFDAARRVSQMEMGAIAIIVDAKDNAAKAFYRHHGFVEYGSAPRQMIAPLKRLSD